MWRVQEVQGQIFDGMSMKGEVNKYVCGSNCTVVNIVIQGYCTVPPWVTFTFTFTFSHLADAFVQSDVQGRELVDANWKAVLSTEHISHLTQNPMFYRDLNS